MALVYARWDSLPSAELASRHVVKSIAEMNLREPLFFGFTRASLGYNSFIGGGCPFFTFRFNPSYFDCGTQSGV